MVWVMFRVTLLQRKIRMDSSLQIPLADIRPHPNNPASRLAVDDALKRMAASIESVGVLEPIIVRPAPQTWKVQPGRRDGKPCWLLLDQRHVSKGRYNGVPRFFPTEKEAVDALREIDCRYEIVCGHRRFAASRVAGLKAIPALVREYTDKQVAEIQLIENEQRKDLLPSEQAASYLRMVQDHGYTAEQLANAVKRTVSQVRSILLLNRCPAGLLAAVDVGAVGRWIAEQVCRIPEGGQRDTAAGCVLRGCPSPKRLARWVGNGDYLTHRGTRELISTHFQRQLKGAPFDASDPKLLRRVGSCEQCPKRSGNAAADDPEEFEGTREDICLDPSCFRRKCRAAGRARGGAVNGGKGRLTRISLPVMTGRQYRVASVAVRPGAVLKAKRELTGEQAERAVLRAAGAYLQITVEEV